MSEFGTIVQIGDILVSEDVVKEYFACDYQACKGICCIEGDSGAPLLEEETAGLERNYPVYSKLMCEAGKDAVDANGFFELDRDGELVTPLCLGSPRCAYSMMTDEGDCLCAIERCSLKKPVSCKLYPIRVTRFNGGGMALNLHKWDICKPAFEKGRREGIRAYEFLKDVLREEFGEEFYDALSAAAKHLLEESRT